MKKISQITLLFALLVGSAGCTKEHSKGDEPGPPRTLSILTRSLSNDIMESMRIYTFDVSDSYFHRQLAPVRDGDKLTSSVEVGDWYVSMISAPAGTTLLTPTSGVAMADMPLYVYAPTVVGGKSTDAPDIITSHSGRWGAPGYVTVNADATTSKAIFMGHNMAMVEIVITKATLFKKSSANNMVYLHNIPSTISYSGALLPSKSAPDTLAVPLQAGVILVDHADAGLLKSDTIRFLIPAHQGTDFDTATPTDITTLKMHLTVELEREDGTMFTQTIQVPRVALCNKTLRLNVTVTDMVQIDVVMGEGLWGQGDDTYVGGQFKRPGVTLGDAGFDTGTALDGGDATMLGKK